MRIFGTFILFPMVVWMLFGCQSQVPVSETTKRHGVVYVKGDDKPFSGIVVGRGREGYRTLICDYKKQYKDGKLNGISRFWYPNGKLESIEPYERGQINGAVIRYHNNGQMKARIPIRNGMRSGSSGELFWDKKGRLIKG